MDFIGCWILQIKWESINLCAVKLNVDWKKGFSAIYYPNVFQGKWSKNLLLWQVFLIKPEEPTGEIAVQGVLVYRNTLISTKEVFSVTSEYCYFHRKVNCNETLKWIGYWSWNWTTSYVGYMHLSKWGILAPRLFNKESSFVRLSSDPRYS